MMVSWNSDGIYRNLPCKKWCLHMAYPLVNVYIARTFGKFMGNISEIW